MRKSESEISEIDLRSVLDALKLRWWIIPLVMLLSVGFLFANESDLQTSPGHVQINRLYEARDETAVLSIAGIDPASIVPYPSFDNQLVVLQTPESRQKIADSINSGTNVLVARSDQTFTLIDSNGADGANQFTLLGVGTPSYTFSCDAPTADECNTAVDAYVAEISRLRALSIQQGFERAETIVNALVSSSQSENQALVIQRQALATGKSLVTGEMAFISSTTDNVGPTVDTVKASTYVFGLGIGALLGLLIVLQLSVTDRKIRTSRKLAATVGESFSLGTLRPNQSDPSSQYVAAGFVHQARQHGATSVRLLPVNDSSTDSSVSALTQALQGHSIVVTAMNTADRLTTTELLPTPHSIVVLVADANISRTDDLKKTWTVAERAGNTVAGVILVQH